MNKKQLLNDDITHIATCRTCGTRKYSTTYRGRHNTVGPLSMLSYLDRISKCCDNPNYSWWYQLEE